MYRDIEEVFPELKVKKGMDDSHDWEYKVTLDGEIVWIWEERVQTNAPEDLCFHREIGDVFIEGVEAGLKLAEKRRKDNDDK